GTLTHALQNVTPAQRAMLQGNTALAGSMAATPFVPYSTGWSGIGAAVVPARTAVGAAAGTFATTHTAVNTAATGMSTSVLGNFGSMYSATVDRFAGIRGTATGESSTMQTNVTGAGASMSKSLVGTISGMGGSVMERFGFMQRTGTGE